MRERGLILDVMRDLVSEARATDSEGDNEHAQRVRVRIRVLWTHRHTTRLDPYGWPLVLMT